MNKAKEKTPKPLQSIRDFCLHCHGGSVKEVANCSVKNCPFHPYRLNRGRPSLKVIKQFCLECTNKDGNGVKATNELVEKCPAYGCPVFFFRTGKNPNRSGIGRAGGNPSLAKNKAVRLYKKTN